MSYCPNCSAALQDDDAPVQCPRCGAQFGAGSAWQPVAQPLAHSCPAAGKETHASPAPAEDRVTPGTVFIGFCGLFALMATLSGENSLADRLAAAGIVLVLTLLAFTLRRAPWWAWLGFLPVLLPGGCTALFFCCFRWHGG